MNCKQFNTIPLEEVLLSLGHLPTKQNEKEAWYLNPFASEHQASFKLDKLQNLWFLHSEGIGGDNTDFLMKYLNASVSEVLSWAEKQNFSSFHQQEKLLTFPKTIQKNEYQITGIHDLQNQNLKNYLQERGLSEAVYHYIKEVHFTIGDKNLYAIGFENQSGGFELRNSFYKGSLLSKDISVMHLGDQSVKKRNAVVFEGFMDALSLIEMKRFFSGDIIVMNSTALLSRTKEQLKNYSEVYMFLDNDNTGLKCKSEILQSFPHALDCSGIYSEHKDLNEYLAHKIKAEKSTGAEHPYENLQESREKNEQQESENKQGFKRKR
ncbi:toprim domain-containing protein [Chryseobacterium rhizoplanae]|uniref:toprim domain-containing protein n=1 Tax=Chryseobacterium rhizoplanae TaxID=1609531 RepID=UPI001CE30CB0|nr:toprim domain-containing protein [Chryseobacterium rhizoplanae]UCA58259.1 toprim domain-containing protein [Chryseobacterium rhizoplanae]